MKKLNYWILSCLLLILMSCGSDNKEGNSTIPDIPSVVDKIELSNSADESLPFDCVGGSKEIKFKATKDWKAVVPSSVSEWLSVSPILGTKGDAVMTITTKDNKEYQARVAEIVIAAGTAKKIITIMQVQKDAIVIANPSYTVGSEGGEVTIEVSHNVDYKTTINSDWITQKSSRALVKDKLVFVIAENPKNNNREGLITFTSMDDQIKQEVKIYQSDKKELIVSTKELSFDNKVHEFTIEVKANVDYIVTDPSVNWIHRVESKALTSRTIHYELSANESREERTAEILITSTDRLLSDKVSICQSGVQVDEKAILEAFYRATDGEHWKINTNWCSDKPLSEWYGIKTEGNNVVTIQLPHNNLKGQLPDELRYLTSIGMLNVEENQLEGNLPDFVDKWSNLFFLGLGRNNFIGKIPESYVNLTHLTYFSVFSNKLSGEFPFFMMDMPNWDKVIKEQLEPQQPGYGFTVPATAKMISLGNDLYLHPEGNAIELRMGKTEVVPENIIQEKMKYLYTKFNDEFDFIHLIYNIPKYDYLHVKLSGEFYPINNKGLKGIGSIEVNRSSEYGSQGRLKGVLVAYGYNTIGVTLHEICHYWGAIDINQESLDTYGNFTSPGAHWGISDVNGVLGGFKGETLERNVDGNPKKYKASSPDGDSNDSFTPVQMSSFSFAPIELYLMGLLSKDEVPAITIFKNVSGTAEDNPYTNGVFYAEKEVKVSIDDVIQKYGERVPNYVDAQKDFRLITIVITKDAVNDREWSVIQRDLKSLESDSPTEKLSFMRATGNRGSLKTSGIDKCKK